MTNHTELLDAEYEELRREQTGGPRMLGTVMVYAGVLLVIAAAWSAA
jgi:hypothetical protein